MCVFGQSTTKIHPASVSASAVRAMWATNSGSVRVASSVGPTTVPVTTSGPAVSVVVPCRAYSNSRFGTLPGSAGLSGAFRSRACSDVASSTRTACVPCAAAFAGASR